MKNFLLFIFSLLVTLVCLDIFLKQTRITAPTIKYYDEKYGSLNRANMKYFKSVEGLFFGNTNYDGRFRENYAPRKSDKRTLRILLLGDSFAEGIDVFPKNHFAQIVEDSLGKKLGRKVEVINYGKGNSTIHSSSYFFLNYLSKKYDVDLVFIFADGRDLYNMPYKTSLPSTCYVMDSNNHLIVSDYWKQSPEYRISVKLANTPVLKYYEDLAYFRLLYRAYARVKINGFGAQTLGKLWAAPKLQSEKNYTYNIANEEICPLTQKLYDTMYSYDKAQVVFILRNKPINAPVILEYVKSKNYQYINLADTFDNFNIKGTKIDAYYFKATNTYGGHWNNEGHEAVGNYLVHQIYKNFENYKMPGLEK